MSIYLPWHAHFRAKFDGLGDQGPSKGQAAVGWFPKFQVDQVAFSWPWLAAVKDVTLVTSVQDGQNAAGFCRHVKP